jgi:hypothetical protein
MPDAPALEAVAEPFNTPLSAEVTNEDDTKLSIRMAISRPRS